MEDLTTATMRLSGALSALDVEINELLKECATYEGLQEFTAPVFPFGLSGTSPPLRFYPGFDPRFAPPSYRLSPTGGG